MKPEKSVGMFIGAVIIGPLFLLTTFDPNYNIINDFINADTKDKITKILGYLIFIVGGYLLWIDSIIGPLEDKIEQLKKNSSDITSQLHEISNTLESLQEDLNKGKPDKLLYEVAISAVEWGAISNSTVQRRFNISFNRANKIVEQLYHLGVCSAANENKEPRAILLSLEEIQSMKDNGKFE